MAEEEESDLNGFTEESIEESSAQEKTDKEAVKSTKFQSPVPILRQIRNLIFGRRIPDIYTQITFYINVVLWTTFMVWNIISYFALTSKDLLLEQKGIPIEQIIAARASELGYTSDGLLSRLTTYHSVSVIVWAVVFFGLILLYRKSRRFIHFVLGGIIFYIGMSVFYIGFNYFIQDTTAYDKIALLIMIVSCLLHSYLMKNERRGGTISFFGEPTRASE